MHNDVYNGFITADDVARAFNAYNFDNSGAVMSHTLKVTAIGSSTGIVLSKEVLAKLHVEKGDRLSVTETPNGILLSPYREDFEAKMEVAKRVMRKNRDALRKLAK